MLKVIPLLIAGAFLFEGCKSTEFTQPTIKTLNNERKIEYYFPITVTDSISDYLSQHKPKTKSSLIVMQALGLETQSLILYTWEKPKFKDKIGKLAKLSNRIVEINGMEIPILLDIDFRFSPMGFTISGGDLKIVFKGRGSDAPCEIISLNKNQ